MGYFWCGVTVFFFQSTVLRFSESNRCVVSLNFMSRKSVKKSLCLDDLLLFHDKRIQILKGLPS